MEHIPITALNFMPLLSLASRASNTMQFSGCWCRTDKRARDTTVADWWSRLYTLYVRHPIDIAIMFSALWLLGSMVIDYLTPKELTVYMIAAAIAPAVIGTALSYYLRFPTIDFVLILATLWLVAALTIVWISPVSLPGYLIGAAVAPALIVGAILIWHRYRSNDQHVVKLKRKRTRD